MTEILAEGCQQMLCQECDFVRVSDSKALQASGFSHPKTLTKLSLKQLWYGLRWRWSKHSTTMCLFCILYSLLSHWSPHKLWWPCHISCNENLQLCRACCFKPSSFLNFLDAPFQLTAHLEMHLSDSIRCFQLSIPVLLHNY